MSKKNHTEENSTKSEEILTGKVKTETTENVAPVEDSFEDIREEALSNHRQENKNQE